MCGIAGGFDLRGLAVVDELRSGVERASEALRHRGPDGEGLWVAADGQAVLGHRRLAILDLSAAGAQPMSLACGLTIAFNGEVYNYRELRAELEKVGVEFRSGSDTEVVLRAYEQWGSRCVERLRGMFAFALWDAREGLGFLARDGLGIKPLYVWQDAASGRIGFASELRALVASGWFQPQLNEEAVAGFLRWGTVPEPLTLVCGVEMLGAGQWLRWKAGKVERGSFWQVEFPAKTIAENAVSRTREALLESVKHHFVSDVPVGIFLSGGIDSTALLALANEVGHRGVGAFCIAVDDEAADESSVAQRTARHFGAHYHEMRLDAARARELFTQFLECMDQPSIDGLNTFTVSALARREGMKVVLSGLGGDEVFGGYSSFQKVPQLLRLHAALRWLPGSATLAGWAMGSNKGRKMQQYLQSEGGVEEAWGAVRGIFEQGAGRRAQGGLSSSSSTSSSFVLDAISKLELTRYMRNQLLRDSDVMSMAHGLELRVPFVDTQLFAAVASIPSAVRLARGKQLLTDAVPEVPEWVVKQKKRGFLFPYEKWLNEGWGKELDAAGDGMGLKAETWYQRWALFVLKRCRERLGV